MSEAILESGWTTWGNQERLDAHTTNQKDSQSTRILPFPGNQDGQEDTTTTDRKVQNDLWVAIPNFTDATSFNPQNLIRDTETPIKLPSVLRAKIQGRVIPHDVHQFCIEKNLLGPLSLAQEFVKRCFSGIQDLKLRLVVDPEDNNQWVEINIIVPETSNFLIEYNNYTRLLVANIPWLKRSMLRFNFSFA